MNISVLTSSYPRFKGDGTAPFVKSIAEALAKLGHKIEIVAPYDIAVRDDLASIVKVHRFKYIWPASLHIMGHARTLKADVNLHPLALILLPFFLLASIFKLIRVSRKMGAEAIHAHWVLPNGFAAAIASKVLRIPFIISLHGSDMFMADRNFLFRAVARWTFNQCSSVTACSQELHDRAKMINKNVLIDIIPWGADPNIFKPANSKDNLRKKYNWSKKELIITTLGRMVYKKGFDQLILIAKELAKINPKIKLVIGGSGPLQDSLRDMAKGQRVLDIVLFPGRIPWNEVSDFMAASDIFVLPSRRDKAGNLDGLPTVLLEAMACGLPAVANDIGGVNLVIEDHKNGILNKQLDLVGLKKGLSQLIIDKDLRMRIGQNARMSVVNKFNWKNTSQNIEKLLQNAVDQ
ncbi:MAG: glycosyltransferase [Pseudomonadota bacterium]|nr:glycosyltransferase [Pseudomonadota bacterium]